MDLDKLAEFQLDNLRVETMTYISKGFKDDVLVAFLSIRLSASKLLNCGSTCGNNIGQTLNDNLLS